MTAIIMVEGDKMVVSTQSLKSIIKADVAFGSTDFHREFVAGQIGLR